jgi:peptide/nickel transport system substrate-binding protein
MGIGALVGRTARLAGAWLGLIVLLAACAQNSSTSTNTGTLQSATLRIASDWTSLNPAKSSGVQTGEAIELFYDRLIAVGADGKLLPYLATSWTATPTSYMFHLRTDAVCADGTQVTPTVVANSFKYFFANSPRVPGQFGRGPYTVTADDSAATLTVALGTPFNDALANFATPYSSIVCPAGLAHPDELTNKVFGSGPYTPASMTHGDSIVAKVRPEWKWGPADTNSSTVAQNLTLKVVVSETTAANLLLSGGLDIANVTGVDLDRLVKSSSLTTATGYSFFSNPLLMNPSQGAVLSDPKLRQAVMTAIDPKAWVQAAFNGYATLSGSILSKQAECYSDTSSLIPTPSSSGATQLIQSDGYTTGSGGVLTKAGKPLTIRIVGSVLQGAGPAYLQQALQKVGINAVLNATPDNATFLAALRNGNFDIAVFNAYAVTPNPTANINLITGTPEPVGNNYGRIQDPLVEAALAAANAASTESEKCSGWKTVQEDLIKDYDLMPMADPEVKFFSTKGIQVTEAGSLFIEPVLIRRAA